MPILKKEILRDWQGVGKGPHELRVGNAAALGFILKCSLPFTAKGLGAHARSCKGTRPPRPLELIASCSGGDGERAGQRQDAESQGRSSGELRGSTPGEKNSSPGFLPPLIAADRRINMMSPALIHGSSTPGSAAA